MHAHLSDHSSMSVPMVRRNLPMINHPHRLVVGFAAARVLGFARFTSRGSVPSPPSWFLVSPPKHLSLLRVKLTGSYKYDHVNKSNEATLCRVVSESFSCSHVKWVQCG